jgi:hypothetical protein
MDPDVVDTDTCYTIADALGGPSMTTPPHAYARGDNVDIRGLILFAYRCR